MSLRLFGRLTFECLGEPLDWLASALREALEFVTFKKAMRADGSELRDQADASFTHARGYGLETGVDLPKLARYGLTGSFNYALGRVYFYNPVTGGFVTEPEHLESTERFLAPMDQTHTLTGGLTYRHQHTGLWAGTAVEYGSGTPTEREETMDARVPGHFTANVSVGVDLLRNGKPRPRLSLQLDIENITH